MQEKKVQRKTGEVFKLLVLTYSFGFELLICDFKIICISTILLNSKQYFILNVYE